MIPGVKWIHTIHLNSWWKRTGISIINTFTFVVSVALCRISPGQNSWEATVTAVRLKLTLPPASNVVSRLCSSWKMYFRTELWRTANRMENPPNPRIISRADSYRSKTGFTLLKENTVMLIGEISLYKFIIKFLCTIFIQNVCIFWIHLKSCPSYHMDIVP